MDPDSPRLRVSITDGRGRPLRAAALARWLARVAPRRAHGEVTIALVSDREIQDLNRRFRHHDTPTDVLSFPRTEPRAPSAGRRAPSPEPRAANPDGSLGDIAIATGVARRQAREAGHSYDAELRVLALHGLLHLIGYDHDDRNDRGRMARLERRLRRQGGLEAGLIERLRQGSGEPLRRAAKAGR